MTSIVTALIPILFGLGYFCFKDVTYHRILIPLGLSLISLGIAVLMGFYIIWSDEYIYNDPYKLIQKYHDQTLQIIIMKTAVSWSSVINENLEYHNKLALQYGNMLIVIGAGLANLVFTFWLAIITILK